MAGSAVAFSLSPAAFWLPEHWRESSVTSLFAATAFAGGLGSSEKQSRFTAFISSKNGSLVSGKRRVLRSAAQGRYISAAVGRREERITENKRKCSEKRRVVVTGMGVVTPLGHDPDVLYDNLLNGVSGITEIEAVDCSDLPMKFAGQIKSFSADGYVETKLSKRLDKFMIFLLTAGKKALQNGGLTEVLSMLDKTKCGVIIGSVAGGINILTDAVDAVKLSYKKISPFALPLSIINMGPAMLAIDLGWMGPNYAISASCSTSNFCILNAANHIIRDEADVMLCGGSDGAIVPLGLLGSAASGAISRKNYDLVKVARASYNDSSRHIIGEGAAVLLLEELKHAENRGANIYAEFLGGSCTCKAYHLIEPHSDEMGMYLSMENALHQSGVSKEDVNYINSHASLLHVGDHLDEYQAIIRCFGQNPDLRVNSTKPMIGNLLGAAGAVEAVAVVQAIQTGWVHPNINLNDIHDTNTNPKVLVGSEKEKLEVKVALSNSFGFGGHNSSILFAPYK